MIYSTGSSDDRFAFRPFETLFTTWEDTGGNDTLVLFEYQADPHRQFRYNGSELIIRQWGEELRIPDDQSGMVSIENIEWRQSGDVPTLFSRMNIVTDLSTIPSIDGALTSNVAIIGRGQADIIITPLDGEPMDGFSEIYGNGGRDTILLSPVIEFRAFGGRGSDVIIARGAPDTFIAGGRGRDTLKGAQGDDTIFGGKGLDTVRGRGGDDFLYGDSGFPPHIEKGNRDRIFGGHGDDFIFGGHDGDVLTGGSGSDTFAFQLGSRGPKADVITDFSAGEDLIILDTDTHPGRYSVRVEDGDTHLFYANVEFAILRDVELTRSEIDFF